jgi:hypothetical protein
MEDHISNRREKYDQPCFDVDQRSDSCRRADHLVLEGDALGIVLIDPRLCNFLGREDLQILALIGRRSSDNPVRPGFLAS